MINFIDTGVDKAIIKDSSLLFKDTICKAAMTKSDIQNKIQSLKIELARLSKNNKLSKSFLEDYSFPEKASLEGVKFSSVCANIKPSEKLDLTLIELVEGSSFSGVFTKSETRSSPVKWCEKALQEEGKVSQVEN